MDDGDTLVVATSGSTGDPKGVVLSHDAVRASALATSGRLGVGADDHWLACLPLAHVGGLSVVTTPSPPAPPSPCSPGFDADAVADAAAAGATLVSLVATALARVDAAGFRWIVLGGAAAPPERPDNVVVTYGATETGSGVVYDGVPLDGVEVAIADDGGIRVRRTDAAAAPTTIRHLAARPRRLVPHRRPRWVAGRRAPGSARSPR